MKLGVFEKISNLNYFTDKTSIGVCAIKQDINKYQHRYNGCTCNTVVHIVHTGIE